MVSLRGCLTRLFLTLYLGAFVNSKLSMTMNPLLKILLIFSIGGTCIGCSKYFNQPIQDTRARIGEETGITDQLRGLPEPANPLYVAVYKFRDQTGQYRPLEVGSGFSTVVTQGATNILIKALEESKYFIPIERENVGNLLNERKIIRSSRIQYEGAQGPAIPSLLFANMILEGGIVSYDANIVTGGAGARYFGAGGQVRYRQDRVTIYLLAVATNNGEILKTVYTSKTILSQALDGGIFRFVGFSRLLEVETGYTYNEPSDLAVMEAIEKAVYSLIVEGMKEGYWDVSEEKKAEKERLIAAYDSEVATMQETNVFGRQIFDKPTGPALRAGGSAYVYRGDYPNAQLNGGGEVGLDWMLKPSFGVQVHGGFSALSTRDFYRENIISIDFNGVWRMLPWDRFSPVLYGGVGMVVDQDGRSDFARTHHYFKAQAGGGFEYFLNKNLAIDLLFDSNYLFNDQLDRVVHGKYNDIFLRGRLGIKYFFLPSKTNN